MPAAIAGQAFLSTRVSLLAARLLGPDDPGTLLHAPVEDQRIVLRRAGLTELASQEAITAAALERSVNQCLLEEATQLIRPTSAVARELLIYWTRRFEIANIKTLLRGRLHGQDPQAIKQQLMPLGEYESLRVDALLAAEDIAELLRQLESYAHYAGIAREARRVYEERQDPFTLEASVDRQYFAGLSQKAARYSGPGDRYLREMVGDLLDRVNLVWLLRYRFVYGLPPAEAYYLLVPAGGRLTRSRLLALAEVDSWEQMRPQLPEPLHGWLRETTSVGEVHRVAKARTLSRAREILDTTRFNFARAFAYLLLRENDLRRTAAILKGRLLQLDPQDIALAADLGSGSQMGEEAAA